VHACVGVCGVCLYGLLPFLSLSLLGPVWFRFCENGLFEKQDSQISCGLNNLMSKKAKCLAT
jgi:hypothetical protein